MTATTPAPGIRRLHRRLAAAALGAALAAAGPAAAQGAVDPQCQDPALVGSRLQGGDACQKLVDLFHYLAPQLGAVLAGGNPTLGQGGTLGGTGRLSVTLRATAMRARLPDVSAVGITKGPAKASTYDARERIVGVPVAEVALGVFRGIPMLGTTILGVDALGSVSYVPEIDQPYITVRTPDGGVKAGYGARVGLVRDAGLWPGVAVSWFRRELPAATIQATALGPDTLVAGRLTTRTTSWRVTAGKRLGFLQLAAGYGRDQYAWSTRLDYAIYDAGERSTPEAPVRLDYRPQLTNIFADVGVSLRLVRLVAEVGRLAAAGAAMFNTLPARGEAERMYGSVGLRFGR